MAILKHLSSKSANYKKAVEYLMYEQDRLSNRPLRNEDGLLVMRENFLIDSLECNVSTFDVECRMLNKTFRKNQGYNDVKSHHYIISFDPKDSVEGKLTVKEAQKIGMDFAKKNFPGHQAIVCTHGDGENKSGNIHVHIIINSLRKRDVDRQSFMERKCDSLAGYKHHLTNKYLAHLKADLMDVCNRKRLNQVDLLSPAKKRVTEREYWANARGNAAHGSRFTTDKDFLRNAIDKASSKCKSEKAFASMLKDKYNIILKVSRGRYSYLLPNRKKAIRERMLGTDYIEESLRKRFKENNKTTERESVIEKLNSLKKNDFKTDIGKYPKAFTMQSNLPFVKDLQNSAISITNRAYERRVKINNLKEMANTIMYIEEHGIESRDALNDSFDESRHRTSDTRSALKRSEEGIIGLNEQIHYTGQYLANKGTYQAFLKSKNKGRFRSEHESEIIIYEAARRYLKEHADNGTLPSLKYIKSAPGKFVSLDRLKAKRSELINKQKALRSKYYSAKNAEKEMYAIKRNVDNMLKEASLEKNRSHQRDKPII